MFSYRLIDHFRKQNIDAIVSLAIGIIAVIVFHFTWYDSIWFADDSASYLLMAKAMSPYFPASDIIIEGALKEKYPPLFPFLLAISGASEYYVVGHIIVALFFVVGLFYFNRVAFSILENRYLAFFSMLLYALAPAVWLNLLGILSETLYIALIFITVLILNRHNSKTSHSTKGILLITILLSAILLTRSIGITMIAAFFITTSIAKRKILFIFDLRYLIPIIVPFILSSSWHYFRPVIGEGLYESGVTKILNDFISDPIGLISPQLIGLIDAWHTSWLIYWKHELQITYIITSLFGLLSIGVLILRLTQNKLDAWYLALYLITLLVWPYPSQAFRFMFPAIPFLIIYGVLAFIMLGSKLSAFNLDYKAPAMCLMVLFTTLIPPISFIANRSNYDTQTKEVDYSFFPAFYFPDINQSMNTGYQQEHLMQNMQILKANTNKNTVIMWFIPKYLYLLAERRSVPIPDQDTHVEFMQEVLASNASYVLVTRHHPWDEEHKNGLLIMDKFKEFTETVWTRTGADNHMLNSIFLRINKAKLQKLIQTF